MFVLHLYFFVSDLNSVLLSITVCSCVSDFNLRSLSFTSCFFLCIPPSGHVYWCSFLLGVPAGVTYPSPLSSSAVTQGAAFSATGSGGRRMNTSAPAPSSASCPTLWPWWWATCVRGVENVWDSLLCPACSCEVKYRRLHCLSLGGATCSNYEWFNVIFCRLWNIAVSYNKTNDIKKHVIYR